MKNLYFLICLLIFNSAFAQNPFITVWKTDNIGSSNNNQIRFYFTGQFNYYWEDISNPAINGNGTISGSPSATITFPSAGIYNVEIIPSSSFNMRIDGLDPLKLIEIQQWGNVNWNSMNGSFRACSNLEVTATDTPNLANVSNMNQMFAYCTSLNSIPFINSWDVSNVNSMSGLFLDTSFNSPIGNWNTANVTNMSSMFQGNIYFNQPIGNWDMGNVNSLSRMFNGASSFNQEIGSWDVSNAVFMSGMFGSATSFNQPVNNWNVSNVRKMDSMFAQASSFNQALDSWNVENVETMVAMFAYAGNFNQTLESWKIRCLYFPPNGLYNMFNFSGLDCKNYSSTLAGWASDSNIGINQSLGSINIKYSSLGEDARNFLINSKGWNITGDEFDPECNVASPCDEPDFQPFKPAVPDLFSQIVEDELSDNQIHSIDKEYGDIDGDGDIDMLYVRGNKLHVLVNNAGAGNPPNFTVPGNEIMLNFPTIPDHPNLPGMEIDPVSYRLFDWDNDGDLDLILLAGKAAPTYRLVGGVFLFLNDGNGNFPNMPTLLLDSMSFGDANGYDAQNDFPAEFFQFIEVGDLNNDGLPDLLVSGRNRIWGTAYFENTGTISNPAFTLAAPQQIVPNSNWTNWIQNIAFPIRYNAAVFPLPIPELFSTDCTEKQDLFISESWHDAGAGRIFYHENNGGITNGTLPDFDLNGLTNQFGLNDDAHSNYPNADFPTFNESPLNCYASVVRFVDYFGTGCPIAIVYNYCSKKFYYYNQDCNSMSISEVNSELTQNKSILLYPNPAKNEMNFFVKKEMKIFGIQIFDTTGKLILQPKISENKINTTILNSGIYFVNFQTDKGIISEKLIIK